MTPQDGRLTAIYFDDAGKQIQVIAKIVDDNEWEKVQEGVYTGFSIGGSYVKKWHDGTATRYTAKPAEVSIVDNSCMRGAVFTMVKTDGSSEMRKFSPRIGNAELAEFAANFRVQVLELTKKIGELAERRAAAQPTGFNTNGRHDVQKSADEIEGLLNKALANGKRPISSTPTGSLVGLS